jgi:hypothetical protein
MGARALLSDLGGAGLSVRLIDDKIIVTPKDRLTDPLRDAIRTHRAELVEALKPEPALPTAPPAAPTARIYRLTRAQAGEAHAESWNADTIDAFTARRDAILRRGYSADDADDLAERLTLRDREQDDRRMCIECTHLGERGRCLAAAVGRLPGADRRLEPVPIILQRCEGFGLRKGLP